LPYDDAHGKPEREAGVIDLADARSKRISLCDEQPRARGIDYIESVRPEDCLKRLSPEEMAGLRSVQHIKALEVSERSCPLSDDTHPERVARVRRIIRKLGRELRGQDEAIATARAVLEEELLLSA
jgi:hypothetical protein